MTRAGGCAADRSTSTSSCSSTCWRWRSRPTSPASARCCSRATSPAAPIRRARRRRSGFHGGSHHGEDPRRIARALEDQPLSRQDAGVLRREAGQDATTATARCSIIRWCSTAATWATRISTCTTTCRTCWSADQRQAQGRPPSGVSDQDGADRQPAAERAGQVRHSPGQHRRQHGPAGELCRTQRRSERCE